MVWEWRADAPKTSSATRQPNQAAAEKDHRAVLMEWKDPGNCVLIAASKSGDSPIVEILRMLRITDCTTETPTNVAQDQRSRPWVILVHWTLLLNRKRQFHAAMPLAI